MAADKSKTPTRTPSQIEADMHAKRSRLTVELESLIDEVHPNRIKERQVSRLQQMKARAIENARLLVFNARGDLRRERLIAVGGGAAGFVLFLTVLRLLVRRGKRPSPPKVPQSAPRQRKRQRKPSRLSA